MANQISGLGQIANHRSGNIGDEVLNLYGQHLQGQQLLEGQQLLPQGGGALGALSEGRPGPMKGGPSSMTITGLDDRLQGLVDQIADRLPSQQQGLEEHKATSDQVADLMRQHGGRFGAAMNDVNRQIVAADQQGDDAKVQQLLAVGRGIGDRKTNLSLMEKTVGGLVSELQKQEKEMFKI